MPLLHDVLNAYLSPLLKKHSVGDVLTIDDLTKSIEAAKALLIDSPNEFVLKRVQNLHNSQVKAYEETAKKSLENWVQHSATLPTVTKGETQEAYVARCYALWNSKRTNWQISDAMLEECMYKTAVKRGTETYQASPNAIQSQPSQSPAPATTQPKKTEPTEDTEEDEGEIEEHPDNEEEEGEMMEDEEEEEGEEDDGEDGELAEEEGDEEASQPEETTAKKQPNNKRKKPQQGGRQTKKRATVVKKKTTNAKKAAPGKPAAGGKKLATRSKKPAGKKGRAAGKNA